MQDVVIVFVTASGFCEGQLMQETYAHKVYSRRIHGVLRSAIQVTTASAICAVLDMLCDGTLAARGFVRQEQIPLPMLLNNRFGQAFARSHDLVGV
jgi:saccharopine dehydrogenase-like NADP-dependent oxidoreductase